MNVQLNHQGSQGSAATNVRGGGNFYSSFLYGSSRNNSERTIKICPFAKVILKIELARFYGPRCRYLTGSCSGVYRNVKKVGCTFQVISSVLGLK